MEIMSEEPIGDEETEEPEPMGAVVARPTKTKRKSFDGIRRKLTTNELKSSGVHKMLMDDLDRLEEELKAARDFEEKFHASDKAQAILQEKFKVYSAVEVLSTASLTGGGLILGYVSNIWANQPTAGNLLVVGLLLLFAGLSAKVFKIWT